MASPEQTVFLMDSPDPGQQQHDSPYPALHSPVQPSNGVFPGPIGPGHVLGTANQAFPGVDTPGLPNSKPPPAGPSSTLLHLCKALGPFSKPGQLSPAVGNQAVLTVVEHLSDGPVDPDTLKFSSRFLTAADYEDVVTERNIQHHCGYPLCSLDPKGLRQAHQINYRPTQRMVLPSSYLSKYCTKDHYQASRFFEAQLSDVPIFARNDITTLPYGAAFEYEVQTALMEEVQLLSQTQNKSMQDVIHDLKSLSLAAPGMPARLPVRRYSMESPADPHLVGLSNQIKAFRLAERDAALPRLDAGDEPFEEPGTARTIEGFVSNYGYGRSI